MEQTGKKNKKPGLGARIRAKTSLKWQVFLHMAVFAGMMLLILWLCQVVLLDTFYREVKTNAVQGACQTIIRDYSASSDMATLEETLINLSDINELNVVIITEEGILYSRTEAYARGIVRGMTFADFQALATMAAQNGGSVCYTVKDEGPRGLVVRDENEEKVNFLTSFDLNFWNGTENLLYVQLAENNQGEAFAVLVNSAIAPVAATVNTLRAQLISIMMIMIVVGLTMAFVLAGRIAQPIDRINRTSHELAKGNFDIDFTNTDYKEVKELGETLNYATSELAKIESYQREIIANVSHDLRTPLTMITGYAEIMRDLPGENTPENVQVIIDESNRLTSLVNDTLDLSRLRSGTVELQSREYNLTGSIRDILQRFGKLAADEDYHIDFEYDSDVTVFADGLKITQVVYNLVNNAITYCGDDRTIIVRQTLHDRIRGEKKKTIHYTAVRVEVIDHGAGIAPDKLHDIWQRYYKLEKDHRRSQVGTGLGLSIVRGILELHNAQYGVESTVGEGSCFWFELPVFMGTTAE